MNPTSEFVVGVATTIFAAALIALSVFLWTRFRTRMGDRAVTRIVNRSTSKHRESFLYLIQRYGSENDADLYVTRSVASGTQLAHYSPATWSDGPFAPESIFDLSDYREVQAPVDKKVLRQFAKRVPLTHPDGTPWNDAILVSRRVTPGPRVILARSTYYAFLSAGGALQLELERLPRRGRPRTPRRDRLVPYSVSFADGSIFNPVGANVVTVLVLSADGEGPQEVRVLLQKRANSVAVSPGLHNVVPSFQILAPEDASRLDIRNDLIREYLEELLAYDDVAHTANRKQASPYWYLGEPAAEEFMDGLRNGRHTFQILGMGVDLVHGGLHLACMLTLQSTRQDLYRLKANWEGKLFDIDLWSPDIDELVASHSFQPDGAFALDLARKHLQGRA